MWHHALLQRGTVPVLMEDILLCLKYNNKIYIYSTEHNKVFIASVATETGSHWCNKNIDVFNWVHIHFMIAQYQCFREICYHHLQGRVFCLEDGGSWFFRKASSYPHMMSQSRRQQSYVTVNRKVAGLFFFSRQGQLQGHSEQKSLKESCLFIYL